MEKLQIQQNYIMQQLNRWSYYNNSGKRREKGTDSNNSSFNRTELHRIQAHTTTKIPVKSSESTKETE